MTDMQLKNMMTSQIPGMVIFARKDSILSDSIPIQAGESSCCSRTLQQPCNCKTEASQDLSYHYSLERRPWPPLTLEAFGDSVSCSAPEGTHHHCSGMRNSCRCLAFWCFKLDHYNEILSIVFWGSLHTQKKLQHILLPVRKTCTALFDLNYVE